ncbi:PQQ-binding-like beta-propeller repeat protein [Chitinophaga sp. sic0106]|uniref:outer membrane protein assembly factor BamB family protein n=1 Tax=Chitinophaga sp. sic0106 TaxID=2854785 RepID=UPI001C44CDF9|nr:PQQ-binding-like beta-propeller repeat protein [Chitinophaga sp. sic0106]MBV7530324.1 PQQ-binding-like beta-propeller repeat protein [Chitinophaga sp. sic0106]
MKLSSLALLLLFPSTVFSQYKGFGPVKWTSSVGGKILTSPVLYDKQVIIGSTAGNLSALDTATGKTIWQVGALGPVVAQPHMDKHTVYFGTYNGYYALDARNGKRLWQFKTGGEQRIGGKGLYTMQPDSLYMEDQYDLYLSAPATDDKHVFFGSSDHHIYALDKHSGKVVWKYKTNGPVHGGVASSAGVLIAGSWDTYIYALNAANGQVLWKFKTDEDTKYHHILEGIQATPLVYNNTVYLGTRDTKLYALDLQTGKEKWHWDASDPWIVASAVARDGHLYVGTSDSYLLLDIDATTGKEYRSNKGGGYVFGAAALSGNALLYGDFTGRLFMLNAADGKQLDTLDMPGRKQHAGTVLNSAGLIDFMHCAGKADPALYKTTVDFMEQLYLLGPITSAPVVTNGVAYVGSADGHLYAIPLR